MIPGSQNFGKFVNEKEVSFDQEVRQIRINKYMKHIKPMRTQKIEIKQI